MSPAQEAQKIGEPMENFSLSALDGRLASLGEYLQGKKGAVVVFWSGVCSHCVKYDGYFNAFAERHPELGLVAVASRQSETLEMIRRTSAERKLIFPILHDPGGVVAGRWFTQQTPRAFLLDANRVLLYRGAVDNFKSPEDPEHVGHLERAIQEFLAGEPLSRTDTASFGCAIQSVYYVLPKAL